MLSILGKTFLGTNSGSAGRGKSMKRNKNK